MEDRSTSGKSRIIRVVGILGACLLVSFVIVKLRPSPDKAIPKPSALPVEALEVRSTSERVVISGFGTLRAKGQLLVQPEVRGKVVEVNSSLEEGSIIKKGELLFKIDPRDFIASVNIAKGAVARAQADLEVEKGNQVIAKEEWKLLSELGEDLSDLNSSLALRKPQLKEKLSALQAAKAQHKQAELNLERTSILAPWDSLVIEESVEIGQLVQAFGNSVATLVRSSEFEIEVKIPKRELKWLVSDSSEAISVQLVNRLSGTSKEKWKGRFVRILGDVERSGNLAKVLVEVAKPLQPDKGLTPLMLGTYLEVRLLGSTEEGLFRIPNKALREGGRVWVIKPGSSLGFKDVSVIFSDGDDAVVRGDLINGDKLVTSLIQTPLEGMLLEEVGSER